MIETNYLAHHGIKGQKWGIRRFQNKSGSLTSAGRKRYSDSGVSEAKSRYKSAKAQYKVDNKAYSKAFDRLGYNKAGLPHLPTITAKQKAASAQRDSDFDKALANVKSSRARMKSARKEYSNAKVNSSLERRSLSKHEQKIADKYIKKGMKPEEAAIAARKRSKNEKIVVGTAAVAGTFLAVYGAKKVNDMVREENLNIHKDKIFRKTMDYVNEIERNANLNMDWKNPSNPNNKRVRDFVDDQVNNYMRNTAGRAEQFAKNDTFKQAFNNIREANKNGGLRNDRLEKIFDSIDGITDNYNTRNKLKNIKK